MPDWKQYVREHLPPLGLGGAREGEIREELAQQLEDAHAEALALGATEDEAAARAAAQIPDWKALARELREAEQPLAERVAERLDHYSFPAGTRQGMGTPERHRRRLVMRLAGFMSNLWQDARYGARMLRKSPGFAAIAVLTLALGIGANAAIFSVVNAVLLGPLPYREPSRLFAIDETSQRVPVVSPSYPNFLDWRQQSHSFEQMSVVLQQGFNLSGVDQPERVTGSAVSANFFSMMGIRPILGRDFLADEDKPGTEPVAILTYGLWQRRFGSDPSVVGKTMTLDGTTFTVVGVLPAAIRKDAGGEIYAPIGVWVKDLMERGSHGDTTVIARLRSGVAPAAGRAEMETIAERLAREYPVTNFGYSVRIMPLRDALAGDSQTPLLLLLGAVGLVLLIACTNVANLLLARAAAREKEFAIRAAMGASRGRVLRQVLVESALLALAAGAVGLLMGSWGISWLVTLIPDEFLMGATVEINRWVLSFTAGVSLLTALIAGLAPALHTSKVDLNETLKEGGRSSSAGSGRHRLRQLLAVAQVAMALVLAISSGLVLKSFRLLLQVDPGFNPHNVLTMYLNLPDSRYGKSEQIVAFCRQALERIAALPGVTDSALGTNLPLTGNHDRSDISIEGAPLPGPGQFPHPDFHTISAAYLKALGLPLLRGRALTDADDAMAPQVALISDSLARRYWPKEDPIGKRFFLGHPGPKTKLVTVVGVVGDTKQYGLASPTRMEVYLSYLQEASRNVIFAVRAATAPAALTASVTKVVQGIDPDLPVHDAMTMDDVEAASVGTRRLTMLLMSIFAALALALAAVGIYGVFSFIVAHRTHEIGIRMALGAQRSAVLRLVLGQGLRVALLGVGIGLAGAAALTHLLASLLFGVTPTDPLTFLGVSVLLTGIALLACYLPARRATRVDPLVALRYE